MSSVRKLKTVADAGDPDSVLSRRIDVVKAAQHWYDVHNGDDYTKVGASEDALAKAVRRYRNALNDRRRKHGMTTT